MRNPRIVRWSLLATLVAAGCASAGMDGEALAARTFAADLGRVTYQALRDAVDDVLVGERGFDLVREEEQYSTLYYETAWRRREPFPDEERTGVTAARSRLVVRGRRGGGELYGATFEGENEVRTRDDPTWHAAPVTEDFEVHMRRILDAVRRSLGAGSGEGGEAPALRSGRP